MAGRPSKFQEVFVVQAEKIARLGATDEEIADFFEVNPDTIYEWKNKHPDFSEALKRGKQLADLEVADKLFQRACGYQHEDVDIKIYQGEIIKTKIIKHYPPDTTAAIFWLKNRRPNEWRDKREVDNTHRLDDPFIIERTNGESNTQS